MPKNRWETASHLFAPLDSALGEDDDAQVAVDLHDFGDAVGVAGVVDVAGQAARQGRVDYALLLQTEHVYTSVLEQKPSSSSPTLLMTLHFDRHTPTNLRESQSTRAHSFTFLMFLKHLQYLPRIAEKKHF